jgi:transposase-like protein
MCYRLRDQDRLKIIKLVKDGLSTIQIKKMFKNEYSRQQIAAIRAWVTMGKY